MNFCFAAKLVLQRSRSGFILSGKARGAVEKRQSGGPKGTTGLFATASDKGVAKIARIILKRFADAEEWEAYGKKRMNLIGNVVIRIENYKYFSQNLGQ